MLLCIPNDLHIMQILKRTVSSLTRFTIKAVSSTPLVAKFNVYRRCYDYQRMNNTPVWSQLSDRLGFLVTNELILEKKEQSIYLDWLKKFIYKRKGRILPFHSSNEMHTKSFCCNWFLDSAKTLPTTAQRNFCGNRNEEARDALVASFHHVYFFLLSSDCTCIV